MTHFSLFQITLLRVPAWSLRAGLALVLWVVLTHAPLVIAGAVLWILGSLHVSLGQILIEELRDEHQARLRAEAGLEAHAGILAERDACIAKLETDHVAARLAARRTVEPDGDPVYRRVGLSPFAPDWLVQAARMAYRRRLHPDAHPAHHRQEAHIRYLRAEDAFERIEKLPA